MENWETVSLGCIGRRCATSIEVLHFPLTGACLLSILFLATPVKQLAR